eukprot:gb/GECH01012158.1/.p1 GENE.gb/GECH01012158.1/~~gb/GECH01012158.1/.p1  ORF type:complete len:117 (+),score=44.61 gb/GECH01012158.1/:1-351(+)
MQHTIMEQEEPSSNTSENESWGSWTYSKLYSLYYGAEYCGGWIAWAIGLEDSRVQWVVDEYNEMKENEDQETEQELQENSRDSNSEEIDEYEQSSKNKKGFTTDSGNTEIQPENVV